MSIYTNWDPLQTVIVGNCVSESDPSWDFKGKAKLMFDRILKETKEDLDNLSHSKYQTLLNLLCLEINTLSMIKPFIKPTPACRIDMLTPMHIMIYFVIYSIKAIIG